MQQHALYCFAATATYHALNTSNLSDPVCCEIANWTSLIAITMKVSATGNGSGKDWENAMSSADSRWHYQQPRQRDLLCGGLAAICLSMTAPWLQKFCQSMDLCYIINKNAGPLWAAPSADAVTGAVSQPDSFKTVFDGDILNDDVIKG